jgi:hypothetical protein
MAKPRDRTSTVRLTDDVGASRTDARFATHDVIGYLLDHESELSRSRAKIDQGILHHPSALERN